MNRKGISLMEIMFSVAILGVVFAAVSHLMAPAAGFFRDGLARQQANNEARSCMNTIGTAMRAGLANSVRLSTPNTTPVVPWSRIDFNLPLSAPLASGTTSYTFSLVNHAVQMTEYVPPHTLLGPRTLASNVTKLMFVPVDSRDPSLFIVSLRIDAPLGNSGQTFTTIELNQEIHMQVNY